jgi:RHS repeat-associated protein
MATIISAYQIHCSFSGKEKDSETGYYYFGTRYYNSDLSLWLSVDPMSDKYPNLSPYNYCAWNPMKLVDPNGEECLDNLDWYKNGKGEIIWDNNVCQQSDVKEKNGEYIGDDHALLSRFGFCDKYSKKSITRLGQIYLNSTDYGGAYHYMIAKAKMTVEISIKSTILGNGRKKFNGFNVGIQTESRTSGSFSRVTYSDIVSASYGGNKLLEQLQQPNRAEFIDGLGHNNSIRHEFYISSDLLSKNKSLEIRSRGSWKTTDGGCFVFHAILPFPHYTRFRITN